MSSRFENKVCAITGGAAGFGLGIAGRLLKTAPGSCGCSILIS